MARAESTAMTVANYLVAFSQKHGDPMTNLKLQKLLYYAEGWFLALHGRSLFADTIQAWPRGPAVYRVWKTYSDYQWKPIRKSVAPPDVSRMAEDHLEELMAEYGNFSAYTLERMTHEEPPWLNARRGLAAEERSTRPISRADMREFFGKLASAA